MSRTLCLLYHRINEYKDYYNMSVTPSHFDEQMEFIKNNFCVKRFCDNWDTGGDSIVITFDDGYADNYKYAYPILNKYTMPATIFVCTGNIGTSKMFWWDEILHICLNRKKSNSHFDLVDPLLSYTWETKRREQCLKLAYDLRSILRRERSLQVFNSVRMQLLNWAGEETDNANNRTMSESELRELVDSRLIDIGGHTETHLSLGPRDYEEQYNDCKSSIERLKSIIRDDISVFSYPFGGPRDYNEETIRVMEDLGIKKAATTEFGLAIDQDSYRIPRIEIKDCSIEDFTELICRMKEL